MQAKFVEQIVDKIKATENKQKCCLLLEMLLMAERGKVHKHIKEKLEGAPERFQLLAKWFDEKYKDDVDREVREDLISWAKIIEEL
jgi:hypothetical protein